jgi:hypothetical protein
MFIDKEYLESIQNLIKFFPWRCNDADLQNLLNFTETLVWEFEDLNKQYLTLLTESTKHADLLHQQVVHATILTLQQQSKLDEISKKE